MSESMSVVVIGFSGSVEVIDTVIRGDEVVDAKYVLILGELIAVDVMMDVVIVLVVVVIGDVIVETMYVVMIAVEFRVVIVSKLGSVVLEDSGIVLEKEVVWYVVALVEV